MCVHHMVGDLLSPPDLDRLLVLPSGCGEQNMVRFSLNVVTGLYLMHTNQLPEQLSVKIRNNLQIGRDSIYCLAILFSTFPIPVNW